MNYVGKLFSNVKGFYNEINSATLTGALDVIVLEMPDGSYSSSPLHVRFGKLGVLRAREKVVDIECNNEPVEDLHMKLGEAGEAFFVEEFEEELEVPLHLATSPLPSTADLMELGIQELKREAEQNGADALDDDVTPTESMSVTIDLQDKSTAQSDDTSTSLGTEASVVVQLGPDDVSIKEQTAVTIEQTSDGMEHHKSEPAVVAPEESHGYSEMFEMELSGDEGAADLAQFPKPLVSSISDRQAMTERWQYNQLTHDLQHAFSDTDLTPMASPATSRPPSPHSDTEYENSRLDSMEVVEDDIQWQWGQLPARKRSDSTHTLTPSTKESKQESSEIPLEDKSAGGLFKFMRSTKKIRHQPEKEGIYLSDLNLDDMDPEVASLYLYKGSTHLRPIQDEDNESGRGASLPQSPVCMEREPRIFSPPPIKPDTFPYDVRMSLCGGLQEADGNIKMEKFMQDLVTYDDYVENPDMLTNPNLVVSIGGKYYNWATAAPMMMAGAAFQRPLPDFSVEKLVKQHMPKKQQKKSGGWWLWGGGTKQPQDAAAPPDKNSKPSEEADKTLSSISPPSSVPSSPPDTPQKAKVKRDRPERKRHASKGYDASADEDSDDSDKVLKESTIGVTARAVEAVVKEEAIPTKYKKTIRLSSEQLKKLKLRPGKNEVTFSVTTQYQGTTKCQSYVYLWKWDDRIIVSDIDGTITRSDVLGQLLPMVGKDWSQAGIANLYSMIAKNGYKFVYLSARAIGQSKTTRDYLRSIRQGEDSLPDGPLLLSPSSLITAFHKEVIERKPEEFKISCLRDIGALFPSAKNPFYAGFGNKINDVWAYRAVGVPISRIFTVNHRGELKLEQMKAFQSTYTKLSDIVDHFFPALVQRPHKISEGKVPTGDFHAPDEFSTFTYWREPLVDIEEELTKGASSKGGSGKS